MEITIASWRRYNPRTDVKKPSWFRFEHDFFEHPDFLDFDPNDLASWVYILSQASKRNSDTFTVTQKHVEHIGRIKWPNFLKAVEKLKNIKVIHVHVTSLPAAPSATDGRDETRRTDGQVQTEIKKLELPLSPPTGGPVRASKEQVILDLWNKHCGTLPKADVLNDSRRKGIAAALKEVPDIAKWLGVIQFMASDPWHTGKTSRDGWVANLDFLLKKGKCLALSERLGSVKKRDNVDPEYQAYLERKKREGSQS